MAGRARRFYGVADRPGNQYARWMGILPVAEKGDWYCDAFKSRMLENRADERLSSPFDHPGSFSPAELPSQLDVASYLPDDLLVKVDIATMANSLEGRSPFLDYRIAEFAARLPLDLKIRGGRSKYLIKRAMRDRIPTEILNRKKSGFGVPLARWFRGELRPMVQEVVLGDRALARGYFEPAAIRSTVDDHVEGRADFAQRLWALLVLELWHQEFIDTVSSNQATDACVAA